MGDKMRMGANHLVPAYFAEIGRGSRQDITRFVFDIARKADELGANISWDIIFRGCLADPKQGIRSETVDGDIWYWYSNNFLRECHKCKKEHNCYEMKDDKLSEYTTDNISHFLKGLQKEAFSENDMNIFKTALNETLKKYRKSICYQIR